MKLNGSRRVSKRYITNQPTNQPFKSLEQFSVASTVHTHTQNTFLRKRQKNDRGLLRLRLRLRFKIEINIEFEIISPTIKPIKFTGARSGVCRPRQGSLRRFRWLGRDGVAPGYGWSKGRLLLRVSAEAMAFLGQNVSACIAYCSDKFCEESRLGFVEAESVFAKGGGGRWRGQLPSYSLPCPLTFLALSTHTPSPVRSHSLPCTLTLLALYAHTPPPAQLLSGVTIYVAVYFVGTQNICIGIRRLFGAWKRAWFTGRFRGIFCLWANWTGTTFLPR